MEIRVIDANLDDPNHGEAIVRLLDTYACDLAGGGETLSEFCKSNLIAELQKRSDVCAVLAFVNDVPAGFSICMEGFSTFACRPLLNIHDLAVSPDFRGLGISKRLLEHIEQLALRLQCCKITLEVLAGNQLARKVYAEFGFAQYQLNPDTGGALFLQKKL